MSISTPKQPIIHAALTLFLEQQPEHVSFRDIDHSMEKQDGYTFLFYDSKKALLEDCIETVKNQMIQDITKLLQNRTLSVSDRLKEMMEQLLRQAEALHTLQTEQKYGMETDSSHENVASPYYRALSNAMTAFIIEGIEDGIFHTSHPAQKAAFISYGLLGLRCNHGDAELKINEFYHCMCQLLGLSEDYICACA